MKQALVAALLVLTTCSSPTALGPSSSPTSLPTPTLAPSMAPTALAIFDMHLHYGREAWSPYPPDRMAEMLNENGILGALVSSAPDEGSFRLKAILGDRIVPTLGPYRNGIDPGSWTRDLSVVPYFESAYRKGAHRGFGEIHLKPGEVKLPVVTNALAFAARENLFLHVDAKAPALVEVLEAAPGATVLWAHAGVDASAAQVDELLAKWPKLCVELSFRDSDMSFHGEITTPWRAVFMKYPDRFMVGTDTWMAGFGGANMGGVNDRLDGFSEVVKGIRAWLRLLPPDLGEAIAHGNAERFFAQLPR
jgi:hypothetical protein